MIYINDDIEHFDWEAALPLLSDQRREQCLKFKHELGRKTCAAAYLLLCEGLRQEYGIEEPPVFEYGEQICFNMSHCREAAICVLSERPVGVDIESIHRYSESLARYTMSDAEMAQIEQAGRADVEFIRLWTLKEAVLKRSGEGIRNDMKHVLDYLKDAKTVINEKKGYIYSVVS